jgi:hypothetical protein
VEQKTDEPEEQNKDERGGHNKEQILLTINAFKKFCLKSDTKKADEIHDYYIKLEELLHETINEETEELRSQLLLKDRELNKKNNELTEKNKRHVLEIKQNRHDVLKALFLSKKCIYMGEIIIKEIKKNGENIDKTYIKLGSSRETKRRQGDLRNKFENFLFKDVFECENYREIEESILADSIVKQNLYSGEINGHCSKEVVLLSDNFNYLQLLAIVKNHLKNDLFLTPAQLLEKQKLDIENKKLDIESKKIDYDLLIADIIKNNNANPNIIKNLCESIKTNISLNKSNTNTNNENENDSDKDIIASDKDIIASDKDIIASDKDIIASDKVIISNNTDSCVEKNMNARMKKSRILKLDPNNTKKIISVYDSIPVALRCPENKNMTFGGIRSAIQRESVYNGFIWTRVKKDVSDINDTDNNNDS